MNRTRRAAISTALVAGAAVLVVAVRRRSVAHRGSVAVRDTGVVGRNLRLAGVASRAARRTALHRARRTFAGAERRAEFDTRYRLESAHDVAAALGEMKGALMKLGQMASYLDESRPEPMRDALASLQQDAPPMSAALAAEVVSGELGAPPERVFAE